MASSLNSVARQIGAALGVAVLIAIIGNPTPLQAMHSFGHSWWFAAACFAAGALACLALEPMSSSGEGPVLAIDVKGGEERSLASGDQREDRDRLRRLPSLPETMARVALLSSANTDESARRHADFTISVRVSGVGLLEFHQIDEARTAGRRAAQAALESAPSWLSSLSATTARSARRTVLRV